MWYTVCMSDYRFTVRGIDQLVMASFKVAAVRMRVTQAEALESAILMWLKRSMEQCPDRFSAFEHDLLIRKNA